jgi:hypothetical protein
VLGGLLGIVHIAGALAALRYAPLRALDAARSTKSSGDLVEHAGGGTW